MRLTSRLSVYLVCSVAAVSLTFAYIQIRTSTQAMKRDLERHQELGESIARSCAAAGGKSQQPRTASGWWIASKIASRLRGSPFTASPGNCWRLVVICCRGWISIPPQ